MIKKTNEEILADMEKHKKVLQAAVKEHKDKPKQTQELVNMITKLNSITTPIMIIVFIILGGIWFIYSK